MFENQKSRVLVVVLTMVVIIAAFGAISISSAQTADPIPDYLSQVDTANLSAVATDLVTLYGPRRVDAFSPYIDGSCTTSSTIVYPKSNIEMSADYVKGLFESMGYPPAAITMEQVPQGAGHNVYVTKVGSTYPDVFIEFSGHMDTVAGSPGGADNASGSSAVIELARVLKDYPNRYSMRFVLWAAEEYSAQWGAAYFGSNYHVQQALARGEQIKAGLVMDHIGWPYPADPSGSFNEISYNDAESDRIADLFNQVRVDYGIDIGFGKDFGLQNSDEHSYWAFGQTAVSSGGGWLYYRPNYHDCGDTVSNIDFTNVLRTAQQNLAVGLKLDAEPLVAPPTPTATPPPPANFPSTGIVDDFNRANGPLGANWSGDTGGYGIVANQLDVGTTEDIYWNAVSYGPDQEAYVSLTTIDPGATEIDVILKSQSSSSFNSGQIDVLYDPAGERVQVWTFQVPQGWIKRGSDIPVTLVNGDQFGARATASGQVEVYRNGSLLATRNISAWPYYAAGGFIGLFTINASNAVLDDFGGGDVSAGPVNTPPVITNPGSQKNSEGDSVSLTVAAFDADGDSLSFSASGLPAGLTINAGTGQIAGSLPFSSAGVYNVTVTVSDGTDTDNAALTWTVVNVNRPPVITNPGSQTNSEGDSVSLASIVSDPDGDTLSFSATGLPAGLTISASTGEIAGNLSFDSAGVHNVSVTVSDGTDTDNATFTWTVNNVNRPPVITDPVDQTNTVGDSVSLTVAATDPDGDALSFSATGLPAGLTISASTGEIAGILASGSVGAYGVVVTVGDGSVTDTASFTWTVKDVNQPPVITSPGNQTNNEGDSVSLTVAATDADGDTLTFSASVLPGGFTINANTGQIAGSLPFDSAGVYNVTVTVSDGTDTDDAAFTWTVADVNQPPVTTNPGSQSNSEGDSVSLTVAATDADGDILSFSASGLPGGLTINASTGQIAGNLSFDSAGVYNVTVTVSDGTDTDDAAFTWTVVNVNRPPVITNPGSQTNSEGDSVSLTVAATDADGDTLTFSVSGLPGGLTINASTGQIAGSLPFDSAGIYNVTVTVSDGTDTDNAVFTWTVINVNRPPVITNPGSQTNSEGDSVSLTVIASDPDGDTLSFSATGLPGGLTINANTGQIAGTLPFDSAGIYNVTVSVSDGMDTDSAAFTWTVNEGTPPPAPSFPETAILDDFNRANGTIGNNWSGSSSGYRIAANQLEITAGGERDIYWNGILFGTDQETYVTFSSIDSRANELGLTLKSQDSTNLGGGLIDVLYAPDSQVVQIWTYAPGQRWIQRGGDIAISFADGDQFGARATASGLVGVYKNGTLIASQDVTGWPYATSGGYIGLFNYGAGGTILDDFGGGNINVNNQPPTVTNPGNQTNNEGDTVSLTIAASDPDGDTLTFSTSGLPGGLTINASTGQIAGNLSFDSAGVYNVTVTVSDGTDTDNAALTWTVADVNQPPVITNPGSQTNSEGDSVSLTVAATDADGDTLTFLASGLPGGLTINAGTGQIAGSLPFSSAGVYNVTVTVSDGTDTDNAALTWTVVNVNRPPVITNPGSQTNSEGDSVSLAVIASDPDGDALSFSATGLPAGLTISASTGEIAGNLSFDSAGVHNVSVTVSDGTDTDNATFNWTVNNVNRPPVITDPVDQTNTVGDSVSLTVAATDPDGDALSFSATGLPAGLTISASTGEIAGILASGSVGAYGVVVTVGDGSVTDTASFTWTVKDVNQPPVITSPGNQTNNEGDSVSLTVAATDADGDTLTFSASVLPGGFTINANTGQIAGSLPFDSAGVYNVTVTVSDGTDTDDAAFTWTVADVNQPPVTTNPGSQSNSEGDSVSLTVAATDADGDILSFSASGLPGGLTINASTGQIAGNLSFDSAGVYNVTVTVSDGTDTDDAAFTWTVVNVNRPPVITNPGSQTNSEGDSVSLTVAATDADGDTLTFSVSGLPGGLTINASTGQIAGSLPFDSAGIYNVTVTVSDGTDTDNAVFTWTVINVNRPPVITNPGSQTNSEGDSVSLTVIASDPDGDTLSFLATGLPGGLTINANTGQIAGSLPFDSAGVHNVTVTVSDGTDTDSAALTWTVVNVNRPPAVTNPGAQTNNEGESVSLAIIASDPDGDSLTYSATGLPTGLTINSGTGQIAGTIASGSAGSYSVHVSVSDRVDSGNTTFNWTVTPPPSFPITGILDNFNRADGLLGSNWSGDTGDYRVANNQLDVGSDEDIYWNVSSFGVDQEAYVTLTQIDASGSEIGLLLKSQSSSIVSPGVIDVFYDPVGQQVQVWTYINNSEGWVKRGANLSATFVDGDQFGVRVTADGQVEIYRNGTLLGTRDVTAWLHYTQGGYVGFYMLNASSTILDDFGGGTITNP